MVKSLLESKTTANYVTTDDDGDRVVEPIGKGLLVFSGDDTISFFKKKFFGGYEDEPDHWYTRSSVMHVRLATVDDRDAFEAEVYFPAGENGPSEVMTFVYELRGDEARIWEESLSKPEVEPIKAPQPASPPVIREKETIIKEVIVKVRCSHCGNLYNERENKCPNCGGR
jgi:hypothetical protein